MLKNRSRAAMQAAMLLAAVAALPAAAQPGVPRPRRRERDQPRWPNEPEKTTELQREIAAWNEAVERRKAEKKLRRGA